ncbi:hypothetical protein C8N32_11169 [Rhodovulum imhoffii]|uniref:Uncharacterized protein n=1 Tax=Rhodovulum imhoffii TaxID=365340 RepID=A0A2T5BR20_9RHOB|nr:hypothetical protein [Rhodovulum imhoffii]MBK5934979.1 hypothetical protein [Rhodovulum imhoffii]PTN01670.1 hypothetical protein C8N32_11169 [Rhodovulum imhoffii]
MNWVVLPHEGLGPLRFGMAPSEVAVQTGMGRPRHVYYGRAGSTMEYRGLGVPLCEFEGGALTRIRTGRQLGAVVFNGIDLYAAAPGEVLRFLEAVAGQAEMFREILLFRGLGLGLSGFYDPCDGRFCNPAVDTHDERAITLYPSQQPVVDHSEPISFV